MKIIIVLMLTVFFSIPNCNTEKSNEEGNIIKGVMKRVEDLEYKISIERVSDDFLRLHYEVRNLGNSKYILYNRGIGRGSTGIVYVEPKANGLVEMSQKYFPEPKDKSCPLRETPIYFAASWLKKKKNGQRRSRIFVTTQVKYSL